jgi:hypothetical protein
MKISGLIPADFFVFEPQPDNRLNWRNASDIDIITQLLPNRLFMGTISMTRLESGGGRKPNFIGDVIISCANRLYPR